VESDFHKATDCGEADGGEDEDHEQEEHEHLPHDPEVLHRSPPVPEPPVCVGHDDGEESAEGPEEDGGEEVSDVGGKVHVLVEGFRVELEERDGFEQRDYVGGRREEEKDEEKKNVDDDNFKVTKMSKTA